MGFALYDLDALIAAQQAPVVIEGKTFAAFHAHLAPWQDFENEEEVKVIKVRCNTSDNRYGTMDSAAVYPVVCCSVDVATSFWAHVRYFTLAQVTQPCRCTGGCSGRRL
jgi:hypothetical protein